MVQFDQGEVRSGSRAVITHSPRTRHVFQSRTVCRTQFLWTRRPVRAPNHWMRFLGIANSPTEPLLPIPCPDAVVLASGTLWTVCSACIGTVLVSCRQLSNLVGSAGRKCTLDDMVEDSNACGVWCGLMQTVPPCSWQGQPRCAPVGCIWGLTSYRS